MERSVRVKRGFLRLAIAGGLIAFCAAAAFDISALRFQMSEIVVSSPAGNLLFPPTMKDEEISKAAVAFAGAPVPATQGELPYHSAISWARTDHSREVDNRKQIAYAWAIAAAIWVTFWLGLSWVVRGFMS